MSKYQWRPGMHEISGFVGEYEAACRDMLRAGLEWLDENPNAKPECSEVPAVFGLVRGDNEDAKRLMEAICSSPLVQGDRSPSDAMMHAVVRCVWFVRANGWDAFVAEMSHKEGSEVN